MEQQIIITYEDIISNLSDRLQECKGAQLPYVLGNLEDRLRSDASTQNKPQNNSKQSKDKKIIPQFLLDNIDMELLRCAKGPNGDDCKEKPIQGPKGLKGLDGMRGEAGDKGESQQDLDVSSGEFNPYPQKFKNKRGVVTSVNILSASAAYHKIYDTFMGTFSVVHKNINPKSPRSYSSDDYSFEIALPEIIDLNINKKIIGQITAHEISKDLSYLGTSYIGEYQLLNNIDKTTVNISIKPVNLDPQKSSKIDVNQESLILVVGSFTYVALY